MKTKCFESQDKCCMNWACRG